MKNPIFTNSCGILYADQLTFAFENGEKSFLLKEIKKFKIKTRVDAIYKFLSIAVGLITLIALTIYLIPERKFFAAIALILISSLAVTRLIIYNRKIYVVVKLRHKRKFIIKVSRSNKKDAAKFIDRAEKQREAIWLFSR